MEMQPNNNNNNNEPVREAIVEFSNDKELEYIMAEYWDKKRAIEDKKRILEIIRNNVEQLDGSKEETLREIENLNTEINRLIAEKETLEQRTSNKTLYKLKNEKIKPLVDKINLLLKKDFTIKNLDTKIKKLNLEITRLERQQKNVENIDENFKMREDLRNLYERYDKHKELSKKKVDDLINKLTEGRE